MSDIVTELGQSVVSRLTQDEYFLAAPGIPVILEDRLDLLKEIDTRLGKLGVCVVVGEATISHQSGHLYGVKIVLSVFERPLINRSTSGTQKTGHQVAMECWSQLGHWEPDEIWAPLQVNRLEAMRVVDPPMVRELELETEAMIVEIAPNDIYRHAVVIYAPHEAGGCVPLRLTGEEGAYQWEFGTLEDRARRPLYAIHKDGFAVSVGVLGAAGAYQWVFGPPSPYRGGVEYFAPGADGRVVPIQLAGEVGRYQWEYGIQL